MKKKIKYTEESMGEPKVVKDFLPFSDQLVLKDENKPKMSYESKWAEYRKRRNTLFLIWITYVPGVFIIGYPLMKVFDSEIPFAIVAVAWMSVFLIVGVRLSSWKCPRCGKPFLMTWYWGNIFARKCMHCKLPKWAKEG